MTNQHIFRFKPHIEKDIFIKDPESSALGILIVNAGIDLIDEEGFEDLTFKKIAQKIDTTEATVYRYFKNKHSLLVYLTAWYWSWIDYTLIIKNANLQDAETRLKNIIEAIISPQVNSDHVAVNIARLYKIIAQESSKSYLTKNVDDLNKCGVYRNYKNIVAKMSDVILEINSSYPYPHMLATTIIEGIHHQKFFAQHLPSLTDYSDKENYLIDFYLQLSLNHIER